MVIKPIDHMILIHDHSHDLLTWSQYVTYSDIKSSSIPISVSSFLSHEHICVSYLLRLHHIYILISSSLQHASSTYSGSRTGVQRSTRKTTSRFQWWWRKNGFSSIAMNESHWKITSRSTPIQIPVVVAWERVFLDRY